MYIDFETTLGDTTRLLKAIERFRTVRGNIRLLQSEKYLKGLSKKFPNATPEQLNSINWIDLKPRYDEYEILRDEIRSGIYSLKNLPDIPTLSEYLETIKQIQQ